MNVYDNRLNTFFHYRHPWPYIGDDQHDTPEQFAKAGFYNMSTSRMKDKIQCYMCGLILNNWKPGDSPMERHTQASPTCSVVVLNCSDARSINSIAEVYTKSGVDSEPMALARLETFTKNNVWPPSVYGDKKRRTRSATKLQSYPLASKMVEAGFIFVPTLEQPDLSMCSYCGFYLCDLSGDPDIWTQHRNHAPHCLFIERWQTKTDSIGPSITEERCLSPERKTEAVDDVSPSPSDGTLKSVTESSEDNSPPTPMNEKHDYDDDKNDAQEHSEFDDSIWDIANVQLKDNRRDWTAPRKRTAYTTTPRITYSSKKRKRSARMLAPGYSKQVLDSPSLDQSTNRSLRKQQKSTKQPTTMQHDLTNSLDTPNSPEKEKPKETAAQLFARLQKRPNRSYTSLEKEKGRALDISPPPPSFTTTMDTTPSVPKRLTKNSLRLSTSKKNLNVLPGPGTTKTIVSSSSATPFASSSSMVSISSSSSTSSSSSRTTSIITK